MNTPAKKLDLIAWLLRLQDEEVLKKIENIRSGSDFWDELTPAEKRDIDEGIAELDRSEKHAYESIVSRHRK